MLIVPRRSSSPYSNTCTELSLFAGLFSLVPVLGLVIGPLAIGLGVAGLLARRKNPLLHGKRSAIAGIILGAFTTAFNWTAIVVALVHPMM